MAHTAAHHRLFTYKSEKPCCHADSLMAMAAAALFEGTPAQNVGQPATPCAH